MSPGAAALATCEIHSIPYAFHVTAPQTSQEYKEI